MPDYKSKVRDYGWQIIRELDEPDRYEPHTHSDGRRKYLHIYDKQSCDCQLTFSAPTWYDLFVAVMSALSAHRMMVRGF